MQTKVIIEGIAILVFCLGYIIASISRSKIDALFNEQERRTKIGINPEVYKSLSIMAFGLSIGCIAVGIIIGLIIS